MTSQDIGEVQDQSLPNDMPFSTGQTLIYGLHGKCLLLGTETKVIGGQTRHFYKLEPIKQLIGKPKKPEPAIWVPVEMAAKQGLRIPMDQALAAEIMKVLSNREYFMSAETPWNTAKIQIEAWIAKEGAQGFAKALSYLAAMKSRQVVPSQELTKTYDQVLKVVVRELADLSGETLSATQVKVEKALRQKALPDH